MQGLHRHRGRPNKIRMTHLLDHSDAPDSAEPIHDWTIARYMERRHPDVRLRKGVRNSLLLATVTIRDLLTQPMRFERFLAECRQLPQCGDVQINRLRAALSGLLAAHAPVAQAHPIPDTPAPQMPATDRPLAFEGEFFSNFVEALETVYQRLWRLAYFKRYFYLPMSIPEFSKTPAVLRAEIGPSPHLDGYVDGLRNLRNALHNMRAARGCILVDAEALRAFFERRGCYAALTDAELREQRAALQEILHLRPEGVEVRVTAFRAARVSSCAVVEDIVTCYAMGGYFLFRDPALCSALTRRCQAAWDNAVPLDRWLETAKIAAP